MSLRFRSLEALGRGAWRIASVMPASAPKSTATNAPSPSTARRHASARSGPTPHDLLWQAVVARWPEAVREFKGAVPNRRYRLDIALPETKVAIEVDGYRHHGKHLEDFRRDRVRQNLLTIAGWRVLRFAAGDIRKDIDACMATIQTLLETISGERP